MLLVDKDGKMRKSRSIRDFKVSVAVDEIIVLALLIMINLSIFYFVISNYIHNKKILSHGMNYAKESIAVKEEFR